MAPTDIWAIGRKACPDSCCLKRIPFFSSPTSAQTSKAMIKPSKGLRRPILYMIVGPHSGYSLDEILNMKQLEERKLGVMYWGYAGSHCRPLRVQRFAVEAETAHGVPPLLVMVETASRYNSQSVGHARFLSSDGLSYEPMPEGVTMIGCTSSLVCRSLTRIDSSIDLNTYRVWGGKGDGEALGTYIRYQVNKACALPCSPAVDRSPRVVQVVATAELIAPFAVHLSDHLQSPSTGLDLFPSKGQS
jgi:hypothetical protein